MLISNKRMSEMIDQLAPVLENRDIVGYAAARNTRVLRSECAEFLDMQKRLIIELGEPVLDDDGNPTGEIELALDSPRFAEFSELIGKLADVEHEVELFTLPIEEAIGKLTGTQLLALDWMFEE
ncbi:MAG: hypothetical protein HFJ75_07800 [Eggerthellaceae bacterium]|nr:hypothetical protein [Eggerthellaceae bacterium]